MYKHLTKQDVLRVLRVSETYKVDALFVVGTHPRSKEYAHLYESLEKLGKKYEEEKIEDQFFSEVKSFLIDGKRIWFDVVYGTAYLSELLHFASILGSKRNVLLGTCGGLRDDLRAGDTVIPTHSFGNESSTRMYQRDNDSFLHASDESLSSLIAERVIHRKNIHKGKLMTVQAMLAETRDDVDLWSSQGYVGIDMESSTVFAVSNHFNVPSAALLYVADNLIKNELTTDDAFALLKTQRMNVRKENFEILFKLLLEV
jgi:purine-nucleoside phosphorylase